MLALTQTGRAIKFGAVLENLVQATLLDNVRASTALTLSREWHLGDMGTVDIHSCMGVNIRVIMIIKYVVVVLWFGVYMYFLACCLRSELALQEPRSVTSQSVV